ncbi:S-layer homology domain-containing protein [Paenibacillus larvae]|uniref:S-layer homology domain-containing protein n=1 Tax=Paenibacillus larvae TaxID=1464 RepID=A0AAP5N2G0_9BACL|nr:S-layer homology domain-containing protein [Paenibacillus larvae]AQR78640.1 hypothetical protein BXP28_16525 [Paenibacillus larvae subsp. larvae]MCY7489197.1 S-layer homology domain-containing protein [Paenibacillus larvae]MCY9564054.1 S-layer homology domain-containing protein [Paenibacillus larvae]MCY9566613.1 S-layer homology domain-containing protein [Paenibacillus larvae]MCY9572431.1 S-layer homology domain-containing protein [Paenibacillus larvae]
MNRKFRKLIHLTMILALMLSLLPALPASAAPTIKILNMYTDTTDGKPTNENQVTRVTKNPVQIKASIQDISESQISTIYYELTNMSTGKTTVVNTVKPSKIGPNEITFDNVTLTEGLNKVVVIMGDTNKLVSAPGWITYTPTTNLTDFKINNEEMVEGKMYPGNRNNLKAGVTAVDIKAKVSNADTVKANVEGSGKVKIGVINRRDGNVYFRADDKTKYACDSSGDLCLRPGDNKLNFVSENASNSYYTTKSFVYDNGKPFAFNVSATAGGKTAKLVDTPTFDKKDITFSASLKVDYDTGTALKYDKGSISLNGLLIADGLNFNDPSAVNLPGVTFTKNSSLSRSGEYAVFDVKVTVDAAKWNEKANPQAVNFSFADSSNRLPKIDSTYNFNYVDGKLAYITDVKMVIGQNSKTKEDIEVSLSETSTNEINELPVKLNIYANANTAKVKAVVDGKETELTKQGDKFVYTLDNLTDGLKELTLTPIDGSGNPNNSGFKKYSIQINNAPYIIAHQITSPGNTGIVIGDPKELQCDGQAYCISGKVVNFDPSGTNNYVEMYLNDKMIRLNVDKDTWTFKADLNEFVKQYGKNDPNVTIDDFFHEGKNEIKFNIYVDGRKITTSTHNVILVSNDAPLITSFAPDADDNVFSPGQYPDSYVTNQKTVKFKGKYALEKNGTLTMKVRYKNGGSSEYMQIPVKGGTAAISGNDVINTVSQTSEAGNYFTSNLQSGSDFYTNEIKLAANGETIIEFQLVNSGNVTVTKTITIARQNSAFVIKKPLLTYNSNKELQANINSNFYQIEIEAEGADSITYNKDTIAKNPANPNLFKFEARDLKAGKNTIKFTVNRGKDKVNGSFVLYNTNTPVQGAQYLTDLKTNLNVFDNNIKLKFDKDTNLMRYKPTSEHEQFITNERKLFFGIADSEDGRVDKMDHAPNDYARSLIMNKSLTDSFSPASDLYIIDSGVIGERGPKEDKQEYLEKGLKGRGQDPYDGDAAYFSRNVEDTVVPTKRGTLTLKYNKNIRDDAWKYITVFYFDTYERYDSMTDRKWVNLGGVVDTKSKTITVPFDKFGYYQVMYMGKGFDDITGHPWARDILDMLFSKGIMKNTSPYSFGPNESVTRGEFVSMLVKIFEIPLDYDGAPTFYDVPKRDPSETDVYDYKYIETAARVGIVRGTGGNRFSPDGLLTRQDAAIMIAKASNAKINNDPDKVLASLQKMFTDANEIDYYARTSVEAIAKSKLISGKPNVMLPGDKKETFRFDPLETMTRAEAGAVANNVMKQQNKVPK